MLLQNGELGSALACAIDNGHLDCVEFPIRKGADVNRQLICGEYGSALAVAAAAEDGPRVLRYLVEDAKADVNLQLNAGRHANALAAAAGQNFRCIKYLVEEAGAMITQLSQEKDNGQLDPMMAAKEGGKSQIVEYLERRLRVLPTDDLVDD